jgi:hypothetical protein
MCVITSLSSESFHFCLITDSFDVPLYICFEHGMAIVLQTVISRDRLYPMWPCDVHCQYCTWSLVTINRWLPLDPDQASGRDVLSCYDWQWTTLPIDQFLFVCMFVSSASHVMKHTKPNWSIVMINYSGGDDNQGTYLLAVTCVMMTSQTWLPVGTKDKIGLNTGCAKIKVAHYTSLTLSKTTYFYETFYNLPQTVKPDIRIWNL